jgi:hypothetical protein
MAAWQGSCVRSRAWEIEDEVRQWAVEGALPPTTCRTLAAKYGVGKQTIRQAAYRVRQRERCNLKFDRTEPPEEELEALLAAWRASRDTRPTQRARAMLDRLYRQDAFLERHERRPIHDTEPTFRARYIRAELARWGRCHPPANSGIYKGLIRRPEGGT